jgi:prefoldin subunit 5
MSCDDLSIRQIELIEEIALLKGTIKSLYATRDKLAKIHLEQYSMDTGQVRQFAIYQRLTQVNSTIDKIRREIADLQTELDALSGHGGMGTVIVPVY